MKLGRNNTGDYALSDKKLSLPYNVRVLPSNYEKIFEHSRKNILFPKKSKIFILVKGIENKAP